MQVKYLQVITVRFSGGKSDSPHPHQEKSLLDLKTLNGGAYSKTHVQGENRMPPLP